MLMTLCVLVAVLGVVLIVLGAIPATRPHVPWGLNGGIALLIVGIVLAVVLRLTGVA